MLKKEVRTKYKELRKNLTESDIEEMSFSIANRVLSLDIWNNTYFHIFLPIEEQKEVNTEFILHLLQGKDKEIVISKANFDSREMTHFLLTDNTKIKKNELIWSLELERTHDILKALGQTKTVAQFLVGFALETDHGLENAIQKLRNKNLDLIVLNQLSDAGAGFMHDTNKVTLIDADEKTHALPLKSKKEVAADIAETIADVADGGGYDLLIMGTRGDGALTKLVMGSVATQVLAQSKIPVLLIR